MTRRVLDKPRPGKVSFDFLSDREIHAPPPQNQLSISRVQNWGWFRAQYDWTTGVPDNGMIGGSSMSYLARTPCVPLFLLWLIGGETERLLDYQGRTGISSIVRWNLRPVIFGVEWCVFCLSLGSDNSHTTTPLKIPSDEEGLCGDGAWLTVPYFCSLLELYWGSIRWC